MKWLTKVFQLHHFQYKRQLRRGRINIHDTLEEESAQLPSIRNTQWVLPFIYLFVHDSDLHYHQKPRHLFLGYICVTMIQNFLTYYLPAC